ncbi:MAG: CDP-alcohol phosphatidyltransferase family protein [Ignavibacteriaceae bacterium]
MKAEYFNISNLLSLFRLFLAIPFWFLLDGVPKGENMPALLILIVLGAASDFLDGYFARKFNQITEFGKLIDPLADKVCISAITIKLFLLGLISPLFFYMIIGRDILIFIGGIYISSKVKKIIPSNMLGKITVSFIALILLLVTLQVNQENLWFKSVYMITLGLIIASFVAYTIRAVEIFKGKHEVI